MWNSGTFFPWFHATFLLVIKRLNVQWVINSTVKLFQQKEIISIYFDILLYRDKENILIEIELIIHQPKWYSPTSVISLALLVLCPRLVLLLTDVLSELSLCFPFYFCFPLLLLWETQRLLYFGDTGSHVVQATIQCILKKMFFPRTLRLNIVLHLRFTNREIILMQFYALHNSNSLGELCRLHMFFKQSVSILYKGFLCDWHLYVCYIAIYTNMAMCEMDIECS